MKSPTYCVMSHAGLAIQNHADFCCCNVNKQSWKDSTLQTMHVYSHALNETFNSHSRKIIAAALDNGRRHESCNYCWNLEDAGLHSPRNYFNKKFSHLEPFTNQPRILIIKPGNTCNLACRMCNPMTSSSWYHDGLELEINNLQSTSWYENQVGQEQLQALTFNEYTRTFEHIRKSFNKDNTNLWANLANWLPNLDFVDIYGGEPFLMPALFDWLEQGVQTNASNQISLSLHTNATVYNERYLEILQKYKHVAFNISIDSDDSAQLEYIRHKSDFASIIDNTRKFKKFFADSENVDIRITTTITPLNVYYIDRIMQNLNSMLILPVSINIVSTPEYDIRHLPLPVKRLLIANTREQRIVKFLHQTIPGCDVEWPKFCKVTDKLDELRCQSFAATFPDWWLQLEEYWVN